MCCSVLRCIAVCCGILQCVTLSDEFSSSHKAETWCLVHPVHAHARARAHTHTQTIRTSTSSCSKLQHTTTHCNTPQHTATLLVQILQCLTHAHTHTHTLCVLRLRTLWRRDDWASEPSCNTMQHNATQCNILQHNATTYCNTCCVPRPRAADETIPKVTRVLSQF